MLEIQMNGWVGGRVDGWMNKQMGRLIDTDLKTLFYI